MATITSDNFNEYWRSAQSEYGQALENLDSLDGVEVISDAAEIDSTITMPGVKFDKDPATNPTSAKAEKYVQIKFTLLSATIQQAQTALSSLTADKTQLENLITTLTTQAAEAQAALSQIGDISGQIQTLNSYINQANGLITQLESAISSTQTAVSSANAAAAAANSAATNAKADYVGSDNYVYHWDSSTGKYQKTNISAKGDKMTWGDMTEADKQAMLGIVNFKTGENIATVEISDTIAQGSDALPTSGAVYANVTMADKIVGNPQGDWQPGTAEAYVDSQIQLVEQKITQSASNVKAEIVGSATSGYDTLGEAEAKIKQEVTDRNTAITNLVDGASDSYNTLNKLENAIRAEAITRANDDTTLSGRIDALEGAVGGGGTVSTNITKAINALDADVSQTAGSDGLALRVTQVDGIVKTVKGSITANTYDAYGAAATAKSEVIGDAPAELNTLGKIGTAIGTDDTAGTIKGRIKVLEDNSGGSVEGLTDRVIAIEDKIPSAASSTNQLVDSSAMTSAVSSEATLRSNADQAINDVIGNNNTPNTIMGRIKVLEDSGGGSGGSTTTDKVYDNNASMSQESINTFVLNSLVKVSLTASPTVMFVGETKSITLSTTSTPTATSISITGGNISTPITSTSGTDSLTPTSAGTTTYTASFVAGGISKTATAKVSAVNKIYYGIGTSGSYAGISTYKSVRTNPYTSYTYTPTSAKPYIYLMIPYEMGAIDLSKVKLGDLGYNLQLVSDSATDVDGSKRYRVYRSVSDNQAVTFTITVNS